MRFRPAIGSTTRDTNTDSEIYNLGTSQAVSQAVSLCKLLQSMYMLHWSVGFSCVPVLSAAKWWPQTHRSTVEGVTLIIGLKKNNQLVTPKNYFIFKITFLNKAGEEAGADKPASDAQVNLWCGLPLIIIRKWRHGIIETGAFSLIWIHNQNETS